MWTSRIGKASASTQAPADARGKATPRSPPKTSGPPPAATIVDARMHTRLLWRRSATALGLYGSVALGFLASIVAARRLGPDRVRPLHARDLRRRLLPGPARPDRRGGDDQVRLPLHDHRRAGGELRRLYRRAMVLKTAGAVLAAIGCWRSSRRSPTTLFNAERARSAVPARRAAAARRTSPRRRPGRRSSSTAATTSAAAYTLLTALLRAIGLVVGAALRRHRGRDRARGRPGRRLGRGRPRRRCGVFRRFPQRAPEPLGEDRREIVRFVIRSSVGSGDRLAAHGGHAAPARHRLGAAPGRLLPRRPGAADRPDRADRARAPDPVTEQTRDWEPGRAHGVFAGAPPLQPSARWSRWSCPCRSCTGSCRT